MKTEEEIKEFATKMMETLVDATGESILVLQGFVKGLRWVMSDEKERNGFSEESS